MSTTTAETILIPKLVGGDFELGNFMSGTPNDDGHAGIAAALVLAEVQGVPAIHPTKVHSTASSFANNFWTRLQSGHIPTDRGRKYLLENGGCIYIDLDHIELAMPEVMSALDHLCAMRAMFGITREALLRANAAIADLGTRIHILLNNSDGKDSAFGTHLNVLIHRLLFNRIVAGGHATVDLASFHAATTVLGQGKIGAENRTPDTFYQWSQRADFCRHQLVSENTQEPNRPLVNRRNESHASDPNLARLHCIFYDNNLCQVNAVLKVGLLQIALAMMEGGAFPAALRLAQPLRTVVAWSHDVRLRHRAPLADGRGLTSAEWLMEFLHHAQAFADAGHLDGIVRDHDLILRLAHETVEQLHTRQYHALARKLDGFAKLAVLQTARRSHRLKWDSPQMKMLDHQYSNLDSEGIFWALEQAGAVDTLVTPEHLDHYRHHPPADTRASIRSRLLQLLPADAVLRVDWGEILYEAETQSGVRQRVLVSMEPLSRLDPASPLARAKTSLDLGVPQPPPPKPPVVKPVTVAA